MTATSARSIARDALTRVREREAFAHETLNSLLDRTDIDERSRAFVTRLTYGAVASRGTLDEALNRYLTGPTAIEPIVRDCLVVSAYEILFMETPHRAAVNEGVELVKAVRPRAGSLANAVLRRLSADADSFPWGDVTTDSAALARAYGHPSWIAEMWIDELGRDAAQAIMAADDEPAPLYLAHLPFSATLEDVMQQLGEDGVLPEPGPVDGSILAGSSRMAVRSRALAEGHVLVADAAAQFAAACVPMSAGSTVVDVGAGRGTKTLLLAARARRMGIDVRIIAADLHRFKLDVLEDIATRAGASGIETLVADFANPDAAGLPEAGSADAVLVDAPCSGLGTLRRHPDRRWRARPEEIEALAALGGRLLESAASLVKPGGFVVYSTCTIARRENGDVVDAFLASPAGEGFRLDALDGEVPDVWREFTAEGRFQSLPQVGGADGHFVARLVREN